MNSALSKDTYFAAVEDPLELARGMLDKIRIYRDWCADRGLIQLWRKKLSNYYGQSVAGPSSMAVTRGGAEGELSMIKVNDMRQLIQEQLVTVTSQRPAGIARAINSDTKSIKSAKIGTSLSEFYMVEKAFESRFVGGAERALVVDEAFLELVWDGELGETVAADPFTGEQLKEGDSRLRVHCPWNAARDPGVVASENLWHILTYRINKFDAAAKWPKFRDTILSAQADSDGLPLLDLDIIAEGSDSVYAHLLVHDKSPALPHGRYSLMINSQIVADMALPYDDYPVDRLVSSEVIDSCTGYSDANDLLAMEEITDALHSVISTNQVNFGSQNIVGPQGADIVVSDLAKGVRYFELPPDMVPLLKPLELLKTAPEIFGYIDKLDVKKGKTVGSVSSVLAAQAQQGASGSSMALIQTQSISFNSGTQRNYFSVMSSVMTKNIRILAKFADTERLAKITGKMKAYGMKEFKYSGEDLSAISSVVYEVVNPIMQTYGGRMNLAEMMMKDGQVKSPKQLINFVSSGQLDVLFQDDEADGLLILEENEALIEGRPVEAVITEIHADHIKSHNSLLTQEAKEKDPQLVSRVTEHVMQHIQLWLKASMQNPAILIATNQQPLPVPQLAQLPAPAPHQLPAPGGGGGRPDLKSVAPPIGSPAQTKADQVKPPSLPNVAGTKEQPNIPGAMDSGSPGIA